MPHSSSQKKELDIQVYAIKVSKVRSIHLHYCRFVTTKYVDHLGSIQLDVVGHE